MNLVSCYLPRRTRRYILTIRSLRIYFPRCFPLHLYLFRRVFRCTSRLRFSTPLRLNKSLIQFLEFASARVPDRPSHSCCLIFRDAPREFLAINSSAAIYTWVCVLIPRHGVKLQIMPFCAKGESALFENPSSLHVFEYQGKDSSEREPRISTRDSIINYSGERMRPHVKGSFLNARCGLTDSPPCPPTTPPTLLRPPPTFLTQARRTSWPRDCRMYMYEFAPDQILRRSEGAPGSSSSCFFPPHWTEVVSYERVYAF